jgi:predicted DsbA family dithiol-disulfide isomerase
MAIQLDVWSDFSCPHCFLNSMRIEKLKAAHDITIRWRSFQLRPPGAPDMPLHTQAAVAEEYNQAIRIAKEEDDIGMYPGPVGMNTRLAHIAVQYAETLGLGPVFHSAVMKDYWIRSEPIEDEDILRKIATSVGLNLEELGLSWEETSYGTSVDNDRALASHYKISTVPATLFARKYLVSGLQPYAMLEEVLERVKNESQPNAMSALAS